MPPTTGKARKARKNKRDGNVTALKTSVKVCDSFRFTVPRPTGMARQLTVPLDVKKSKLSLKGHASRQRPKVSRIVLNDEESLRESSKCAGVKVKSVVDIKGSKDAPIELDAT